jgi:predicted AlkP superfamily phosphohydrolase/phosphomutase
LRIFTTTLALCLLAAVGSAAPRVLVLGFDGADDALTRKYIEEDRLPNLKRLMERGGCRPLRTANPAQSPVSWAVFATGTNPGKTSIYDFLIRKDGSYDPDVGFAERVSSREFTPQAAARWGMRLGVAAGAVVLAFLIMRVLLRRRGSAWVGVGIGLGLVAAGLLETQVLQYVPYELPTAVNRRQGKTFWQHLDAAGKRCVVVEAPTSFPADPTEHGKVSSGLGVPDIRPSFGTYFVWSNDPALPDRTEMGAVIRLHEPDENAVVRGEIEGPENFLLSEDEVRRLRTEARSLRLERMLKPEKRQELGERIRAVEGELRATIPVEFRLDPEAGRATILVQGQERTVPVGQWTDHVELTFTLNRIVKPSGVARFIVTRCDEAAYSIVLGMINWNPAKVPPNVRITEPAGWSGELVDAVGMYDTLGWACVTSGIKDEILDEAAFLAHVNLLWDARERRVLHLLEQDDWDCFVAVLTETDRVQHLMWRLIDEKSPRYDADLAARYGDAVLRIYQRMDRLVGIVLDEHVDEETTLIVCSDHGFAPFRRSVHLNTWLVENGYMTLRGQSRGLNLEDLYDPDTRFFKNVDWSRTRAYSMGLGKIYLNLKGREPKGIVAPEESDALRQEIIEGLLALRDEDGTRVVEAVYRPEDVYEGDFVHRAEDLILGFRPGYRVGWQTTLGGTPRKVIEDNDQKWSADHCSVDPKFVPGILFCSRPIPVEDPGIEDLGPTVMHLLGVEPAKVMDGRPVIERSR